MCPYTQNLVGWYWSGIVGDGKSSTKELTFMEWSSDTDLTTRKDDATKKRTKPVASTTFTIENCGLAPHDMSLTKNCIMLIFNAMEMNDTPFLLGFKGAAESLKMAGRDPITAWIAPRPTSKKQFEPFHVYYITCTYEMHMPNDNRHRVVLLIPYQSEDQFGLWRIILAKTEYFLQDQNKTL